VCDIHRHYFCGSTQLPFVFGCLFGEDVALEGLTTFD
jgi:hypothetical protein